MPRSVPDDRLEQLVECATRVFIEQGYRRTQMADVAAALGVAKGTLYLYVESKEALFDLVARSAAGDRSRLARAKLPIATPKPGTTVRFAREQLARRQTLPKLATALSTRTVRDARAELDAVVRELYRTLRANRVGIKLMDRSAPDYPELGDLWWRHGREAVLALLRAYLDDRIGRGVFRRVPDVALAARVVLETAVFWAVHRDWDPHPQAATEEAVEETVVGFVVGSLMGGSK